MKVDYIGMFGDWRGVADAANTTIGREPGDKEPSPKWKRKILLAEHSPIRTLQIRWRWIDLPYWVSVHLVRHKIGIEHFVRTQRSDRTGIDRNELPQGALVTHECVANPQSIINISRKRLCQQASKETREAWTLFLESIKLNHPELYSVCVPECVYRGWCTEFKSCGYSLTSKFREAHIQYRNYLL